MKIRSTLLFIVGVASYASAALGDGLSSNPAVRQSLQTSGGASLGVAGVIAASIPVTPGILAVPMSANITTAGAVSAAVGAGSAAAAQGQGGLGSAATAGQAASAAGNLPLVISDEIVSVLPLLVQQPTQPKNKE